MLHTVLTLLVLSLFVIGTISLSPPDPAPYQKWPTPPKWTQKPEMARYLVHYGFWGVVSAYSPEYDTPFGTVQSFADGPVNHSTGIPYFYIASISDTYKNIAYNNTCTITITMAESQKCREINMDPEEPPCARVTLVGNIVGVKGEESTFAKDSLFSRHPTMHNWPKGHDWKFYKLKIRAVHLLDFYGGATHVPLKDYFAASPAI